MKRITEKGLTKLSIDQLKELLTEKENEKRYMLELEKTAKRGDSRFGKLAGKLNTLDNQIYLISKVIESKV